MGTVFAEITLRNENDITRARDGDIPEQEIRSADVTAVVDTGAMSLVMDEATREKLGLALIGKRTVTVAGGTKASCGVTNSVEICWKDRTTSLRALVLPGQKKVLLGVIPLEDMDLMVDPTTRQLVGAHGDEMMTFIY